MKNLAEETAKIGEEKYRMKWAAVAKIMAKALKNIRQKNWREEMAGMERNEWRTAAMAKMIKPGMA